MAWLSTTFWVLLEGYLAHIFKLYILIKFSYIYITLINVIFSIALSFVSFIIPAALYLEFRGLPYMWILEYFNLQQTKPPLDPSSSYSNDYVSHARYLFGFGVFVVIAVPITIFVYGD